MLGKSCRNHLYNFKKYTGSDGFGLGWRKKWTFSQISEILCMICQNEWLQRGLPWCDLKLWLLLYLYNFLLRRSLYLTLIYIYICISCLIGTLWSSWRSFEWNHGTMMRSHDFCSPEATFPHVEGGGPQGPWWENTIWSRHEKPCFDFSLKRIAIEISMKLYEICFCLYIHIIHIFYNTRPHWNSSWWLKKNGNPSEKELQLFRLCFLSMTIQVGFRSWGMHNSMPICMSRLAFVHNDYI